MKTDDITTLEMASTQQLIDELMNRSTFVGILIRSPVENKEKAVHSLSQFIVQTTMSQESTDIVLETAYDQVVERKNVRFDTY